MTSTQFDAAYYRRFYADPRTRAVSRAEMARRARFIALQIKLWDLPVHSILDAGCGLGLMRAALLREFPQASYTGIEVSPWLCQRFGWIEASLDSYRTAQQYDLVICCDVVQYLPDRAAARALANLGRWCSAVLYFHAPTALDWAEHADHGRSDSRVHFRSADWYRTRLRRRFRHLGLGLHVRRGIAITQWELESPWQ
jgi:SAM-dependent methyltransferase